HDAERQAEAAAAKGSHAQLLADDGQAREHRVQDLALEVGVAPQDEAEDGGEDQQQGEQGEEAVVGNEGREVAGLVVPELLGHPDRKPEPWCLLLIAVEGLQEGLDLLHGDKLLALRVPGTSYAWAAKRLSGAGLVRVGRGRGKLAS